MIRGLALLCLVAHALLGCTDGIAVPNAGGRQGCALVRDVGTKNDCRGSCGSGEVTVCHRDRECGSDEKCCVVDPST